MSHRTVLWLKGGSLVPDSTLEHYTITPLKSAGVLDEGQIHLYCFPQLAKNISCAFLCTQDKMAPCNWRPAIARPAFPIQPVPRKKKEQCRGKATIMGLAMCSSSALLTSRWCSNCFPVLPQRCLHPLLRLHRLSLQHNAELQIHKHLCKLTILQVVERNIWLKPQAEALNRASHHGSGCQH